jgi:hypothetical protein
MVRCRNEVGMMPQLSRHDAAIKSATPGRSEGGMMPQQSRQHKAAAKSA